MEIKGIEAKILEKYDNRRVIDSEDRLYVERFANIGLMSMQYSFKYNKFMAKTTSLAHSNIF